MFVTFEGGEGVGKTTQMNLLKSYLININYNVLCSREPGGTIEGELIRKSLISGDPKTWDPFSRLCRFN